MGKGEKGFTLVEVLLALALSAILLGALCPLGISISRYWDGETKRIEDRQQGCFVLEIISQALMKANKETLIFLEPSQKGGYRRLEFSPRGEEKTIWAFYYKDNSVLKGVKKDGNKQFTGMSLALGVEEMVFIPKEKDGSLLVEINLLLKNEKEKLPLILQTIAAPRL